MNKILFKVVFIVFFLSCNNDIKNIKTQEIVDVECGEDCENDEEEYDNTPYLTSIGVVGDGDNASCYFVRPKSMSKISLDVMYDSDIWYLYTTTSSAVMRPETASYISNNFLLYKPNIKEKNEIAPFRTIPFSYFSNTDNDNVKIKSLKQFIPSSDKDDYVGKEVTFLDKNGEEIIARCVVNETHEVAPGDMRTLSIYEQKGIQSIGYMPTPDEYNLIANAFLSSGFDNDIYDKLTYFFGSDHGFLSEEYITSVSQNECKIIPKSDVITILMCDIDDQGSPDKYINSSDGYIAGYYYPANFKKIEYSNKSNQRPMIFIHAPAAGGKYIGSAMTVLAHEFQHLLHDQYFSSELSSYMSIPREITVAFNECFSSMAESYLSNFIHEKTGVSVDGPFAVGNNSNNLGYITSSTNQNVMTKGRGPSYLTAMDKRDLERWSHGDLPDYGIVASFASYLLVNYGPDVIKKYIEGSLPNLNGIVEAINNVYKVNITKERLLADWGTAVMLSKVPNLNSPYSFYKYGWYIVNGLKVPAINMWLYQVKSSGIFGPNSSEQLYFVKNSNIPVKIKANVKKGSKFLARAPQLQEGLTLTVIAVPKN